MALSYLFDPNKQFQDKNGVNNVGGYLYVFINDSDDHAPTYCNFTGTLNPERIVLDNNGRAVVIVDELKTYRIEVYDRSGNMLWSQYPVRPTNVIYGDYNVYNADIYGTPDEIDVDVETYASGVKKFTIKLANAVKTVIGNIQDTISSIVETVSTKADKVQGATAGNLASLDASGNLTDSGKKAADFATDANLAAETARAQAAEAAAKTEVVQGENCTIEKTTAADGHDVYTVNADGKPQVQSDWNQADSSKVDYIKNKPNLGLKADKVSGATSGNFAGLDSSGNLTDSGKKAADFKTKQTPVASPDPSGNSGLNFIDSVSQNENGEVVLHKNTVQSASTTYKGVVKLSNAIDSTSVTEAATPKAVKDAYDELNNKIVARAVFLSQAEWAVQSQLPGDPAKVYYVENGTGEDAYTVYVWKESTSTYEEVDESSIDLDGYWHDSPTTTGSGNVVTNITLGNDGVPQIEKGMSAEPAFSVLPIAKGGTGAGTIKGALSKLTSETQHYDTLPTDDTLIVHKFDSATASNGALYTRKLSYLWTYIQNKISPILNAYEQVINKVTSVRNAANATDIAYPSELAVRNVIDKVKIFGSSSGHTGGTIFLTIDCSSNDFYNALIEITICESGGGQGFSIVSVPRYIGNSFTGIIKVVNGVSWGYLPIRCLNWTDENGKRYFGYAVTNNGGFNFSYSVLSETRRSQIRVSDTDLSSVTEISRLSVINSISAKDGTAVGSTTTPVYVDSNGQVQPCDPSQMSVGNATSATTATNYASGGGIDSALGGKLDKTGDASNTTSTFTKASGDTSTITSGSKLSALFTAISGFFASVLSSIRGKADKVSGATSGNFAGLDSSGNLTDSGKKAADFATDANLAAETARAQAAEAAAKTEVVQGENCTIEKTTAADGHDVYTVNADGKPQVQIFEAPYSNGATVWPSGRDVKAAFFAGKTPVIRYQEGHVANYDEYLFMSYTTGSGYYEMKFSYKDKLLTYNSTSNVWGVTNAYSSSITSGDTNAPQGGAVNYALAGKVDTTGDASDTTSTFTKASGDTSSMTSGSKLSAIFTAISNVFASFKALAFKDTVGTSDIADDAITAAKVKDNETLPVNISGNAASATNLAPGGTSGQYLKSNGSGNAPSWDNTSNLTAGIAPRQFPYRTGTTTIGGRTYSTVIIGNQEWLNSDLQYDDSGTGIVTATEGTYIGHLYYNWEAAKRVSASVGNGWRLPTKDDVNTLFDSVGRSIAGALLKSTAGWGNSSSYNGKNSYGLDIWPTGRTISGSNGNQGWNAYFWTANFTEEGGTAFRFAAVETFAPGFYPENTYCQSIRLVRDTSSNISNLPAVGSASKPVYVDSDGSVKECGFQVNFGTPIAGANVLNIITS